MELKASNAEETEVVTVICRGCNRLIQVESLSLCHRQSRCQACSEKYDSVLQHNFLRKVL